MDDHDATILPFVPRPQPERWHPVPITGQTASNDWEKGFQTGMRLGAAGIVRPVGGATADEAMDLLRRFDERLKRLVG